MTTTRTTTRKPLKIHHVFGNVMKVAIPLTMQIRTLVDGEEEIIEQDFYPNPNFPVIITLYKGYGQKHTYQASMDGNIATMEDEGIIPVGTYQVEVTCKDDQENPVRYMVRSIIEVVDATIDAGIEAGIEFNSETYTLDGAVFFYAKGDKGDKGDTGEQGVSVTSVEQIQTSHESGGVNIVRVTLSNGVTSDFEVRNGEKIEPTYDPETETLTI